MRYIFRRFGPCCVFIAILAAILPPSQTAGADAPVANVDPAITQFSTCINSRHDAAIVLLIDESGSLTQTDPQAQRVVGASLAVRGFERLVEASGGTARIDLQVAGFAVDYHARTAWTTLTPLSVAPILGEINQFASRNDGIDTDYMNALYAARASLNSHATAMGSGNGPCRAIIWFTDGQLDIERRTPENRNAGKDNSGNWQFKSYAPGQDLDTAAGVAAATNDARELLCSDGGVVDGLRTDGVRIFAVALTDQIAQSDLDFLGSVTNGQRGGSRCGALGGATTGALFEASNLTALVDDLDYVASTSSGSTPTAPVDTKVCSLVAGPGCTRQFEIDSSLQRFHVLAQTSTPGIAVQVTAPGASPVTLPQSGSGTVQIGNVSATYAWVAPTALTFDATYPASGRNWSGEWKVTFIDPTGKNPDAVAHSRIYLFGDVVPKIVGQPTFRIGDTTTLRIRLARAAGTPIIGSDFKQGVSLQATVTEPATGANLVLAPPERLPDGTYTTSFRAPATFHAGSVNLSIEAQIVTRSGITLAPSSTILAVPVLPPAGFPVVLTHQLHMGPLIGASTNRRANNGQIQIAGSDTSDGCAWIDDLSFRAVPPAAVGIRLVEGAREATCVKVPKNGQITLPFRIAAAHSARGTANGTIVVAVRSANSDRVIQTPVTIAIELQQPINAGVRWLVLLILVAGGLLIPFTLLYALNRRSARFERLDNVMSAETIVQVTPAGVTRADGRLSLLSWDDFRVMEVPDGRARGFTLLGFSLRARSPRNPFQSPYATASRSGSITTGSERPYSHDDGGVLPLALAGSWFFCTLPKEDGVVPLEGNLICFADGLHLGHAIETLQRRVADDLTAMSNGIAERALIGRVKEANSADVDLRASDDTDWPEDNAGADDTALSAPGVDDWEN